MGALWRLLMARCSCTGQGCFMITSACCCPERNADVQEHSALPCSGQGALIADNAGQDSWWEQRLAGIPWCKEGKGQGTAPGQCTPTSSSARSPALSRRASACP